MFCTACQCLDPNATISTTQRPPGPCALPQYFNDGHCDDNNNHKDCFWDGNDCCGTNVETTYCSACECLDPNHSNTSTTTTTPYTGPSTTPGLPSDCGMYYFHSFTNIKFGFSIIISI